MPQKKISCFTFASRSKHFLLTIQSLSSSMSWSLKHFKIIFDCQHEPNLQMSTTEFFTISSILLFILFTAFFVNDLCTFKTCEKRWETGYKTHKLHCLSHLISFLRVYHKKMCDKKIQTNNLLHNCLFLGFQLLCNAPWSCFLKIQVQRLSRTTNHEMNLVKFQIILMHENMI